MTPHAFAISHRGANVSLILYACFTAYYTLYYIVLAISLCAFLEAIRDACNERLR